MEFFYSVEIKTFVFPLSLNKNSHYLLKKKKRKKESHCATSQYRLPCTHFPDLRRAEEGGQSVWVCVLTDRVPRAGLWIILWCFFSPRRKSDPENQILRNICYEVILADLI